MAGKPWTDQCKIDACAQIEKRKQEVGGLRKALRELATESDIPYDTLKRWYYKNDDEVLSSVTTEQPPKNTTQSKVKVARKIFSNLKKVLDADLPDSTRESIEATVDQQRQEVGNLVVAEELYEKFFSQVTTLDEYIRINIKMDNPVDPDKIVSQLLRMARNAGWQEPKPPADLCEKCKVTCPDRTCENNVPKGNK
jgi:hypothetical protein